jgi:protein-disulfide isomerase
LLVACGGAGVRASSTAAPAPLTSPSSSAPPLAHVAEKEEGPSEEDVAVPISRRNPHWGNRTALVTIVEFADFECPFCARAEPTLSRIRDMYGPDTIRIVWKNSPLPFHPKARPAAEAAAGVFATAGNVAFWKFHDAALSGRGSLSPQAYEEWARDAGVTDIAAFRAGFAGHSWADAVERDLADAKALGVFGTPTFFVNGLPLAGALPFPTFRGLIDTQVEVAKATIAAGTPPERVYAELVRDNRASLTTGADQEDDDGSDAAAVYKVPLGKSPARGPSTALVTIIEFADYQCPYCVRVEATVKELREHYGDKLRVVFKDAPLAFHPRAEPAAEAAIEVRAEKGEAAFWAMHDELLTGPADLGDESLVRLATRFGARADAVKAAMSKHTHQKNIDDDTDVAQDFEANGTPHFFINGRRLVGAQPKEKFEAIIDEEIRRAQGLLENGTKPQGLYDALVRDGKEPAEAEKRPLPVSLPGHDPVRGSPAAKVTVHEWSDFECPFCKDVEPTLQKLIREYGGIMQGAQGARGTGGSVRIVWHDMPLPMHPDAPLAARAAREAMAQKGERGFWAMHDELFAHQEALGRGDLDGYARGLGLDMNKWKAALDGDAHQAEVDADKDAAVGVNITGTPSFVIASGSSPSGYFISGVPGYSRLRRLIERALAEAK